jgi:lysophospholipase
MTANPDLRSSGPSREWVKQAVALEEKTRRSANRLGLATLVLTPGPAPSEDLDLCGAIATCSLVPIPGAKSALSLEADQWRTPWLEAIAAFIAAKADASRRVGADREIAAPPMVPGPVSEDFRPREIPAGQSRDAGG